MRKKRKIYAIESGTIDRTPPPQNTRKARNSKGFRAKSLAGAEGFEPSARGFGVDVGKRLSGHTTASFPRGCAVCVSRTHAPKSFDDLLMILDFLSPQKGLFSSAFVKKLSESYINNTMHTSSLSRVRQLKICGAKQRKQIVTEVKNGSGFSVVLTKKNIWTFATV